MTKRTTGEGLNPIGLCMCGCGGTAPIAPCSNSGRGDVKGHPLRFIFGHQCRLTTPPYRVDTSGCWVWLRAQDGRGYGITAENGETKKAHRLYYERVHGAIPDGFEVHHRCRNRACVNPDHMVALDKRAHGGKDTDIEYWKSRTLTAERIAIMALRMVDTR